VTPPAVQVLTGITIACSTILIQDGAASIN
jgi:hypothetical protein